ncbi:MAG: efflux RND transporter permease subunit, partial [Deltaproteobacteria bacterium]
MLRSIVTASLRFRAATAVLACLLLAYGVYVAAHAKLDVFPDFVQPQVVIQTECPGLSPEQAVRSESIQGLSIITVVFREGTDIFLARQMLAERLRETAGQLPLGVKTPKMTPLTSSTMDLLKIGLVSTALTPMDLRTFADWVLKPRLLAVPGVAKCSVFGGEVRQLQIRVMSERLVAYDLSLSDVVDAARASTGVMG